ncbi:DciA family protein [Streptomyces sp. NPDC048254]|uniref:DciA family protein n=1 Tax=Streptomyces sp. NPDC048254 TaxID=3365525 RepID=UPI00371E5ED8
MASAVRHRGREPLDPGAAIGALVTERAWELPAAGATLRERWEAIAPELAGHVVAVGCDADSGRLTVCPESAAWATKTRLEQARVIAAANASAGRTVVRHLRILAPGSVPARAGRRCLGAGGRVQGASTDTELASDGYRCALAAHRQTAPRSLVDQDIVEAVERRTRAMRELGARAFRAEERAGRCSGFHRDGPRPAAA